MPLLTLALASALAAPSASTLAAIAAAPGPMSAQEAQYGPGATSWAGRLRAPDAPPAGASIAVAAPPPSTHRAIVYGYWPYWGPDPTKLDFDRLTHVAIFDVAMNSDGSLSSTGNWTDVAPAVVPIAHAHGVQVDLCVTSFSADTQNAVLNSSSRRATLIANLVALVNAAGADGVNVDFEGLSSSQHDNFPVFIEELQAAVGEVFIATPAIDWNGAFDYDRLANASDGLFIMGYDYHWPGGDPGPNAPLYGGGAWGSYSLDWSVQDYVGYDAPPDKIILGLPTYGQEWPVSSDAVPGSATGTGWSVTMEEAVPIAASEGRSYDTITHTPYVLRSSTQLWYDDTASVQDRIAYAMGAGLGGVGFWALGYEGDNPDFWDMVESQTVWEDPVDTGSAGGNGGDSGGNGGTADNGGAEDNGGSGDNGGSSDTGGAKAEVVHGASGCSTAGAPSGAPAGRGLLSAAALMVAGLAGARRRRGPPL